MTSVRLPLSAAYYEPAYVCCCASACLGTELVHQLCRIYAVRHADVPISRQVAAFSGGRAHDVPFLPRSHAGTAGGLSIHRAVRAPIARTDRQCVCEPA